MELETFESLVARELSLFNLFGDSLKELITRPTLFHMTQSTCSMKSLSPREFVFKNWKKLLNFVAVDDS